MKKDTTFTREQLQDLWEAEVHFDSVIHTDSIKNAPKWLTERVVNIFEKATKQHLNIDYYCPVCVMRVYRIVAPIYFKDKKYYALKDEQRITNSKNRKTKRDISREDSKVLEQKEDA